jgi:hypothetical protein
VTACRREREETMQKTDVMFEKMRGKKMKKRGNGKRPEGERTTD